VNSFSPGNLFRWRVALPLVFLILVLGIFPVVAANAHGTSSQPHAKPFVITAKGKSFTMAQTSQKPPTDAQCRTNLGVPCYSPQEIRKAYGATPLLNAGFTGKGQSIVIIDSFGSPTIRHDLHVFDQGYGLPDPPSFKILAPLGTVPFNPNNSGQVGWAFETTLDVEWSHVLAPEANIVLMTSPVNETEGVQGLPQFLFLEKYALDHHLGKIISQSWGATEETLFTPAGRQVIADFERFYERARDEHVTVLASSGDTGSTNFKLNLINLYPFPVIGFPASSPLVTAVGGTSLFASTSGNYQDEIVWNNSTGASGGGISEVFKEPNYQQNNLPSSDQKLLNGNRGMPDIAYNADPNTGILVYVSFISPAGFYLIGGTSEGSPQWAGIIADADQLAGHSLGFLNPALYAIGNSGDYHESFHDITFGSNAFAGVRGFKATPGWDLSTGWGSPKVATLVTELIERIPG
jgi:subtilase family serine protease